LFYVDLENEEIITKDKYTGEKKVDEDDDGE